MQIVLDLISILNEIQRYFLQYDNMYILQKHAHGNQQPQMKTQCNISHQF